jgi:hypothetical protein
MARAPMPAPQMIETPAMRRSAALAQALQDLRKAPQQIGGYGDLGARLLAQGITQWAGNKAERKVKEEGAERVRGQTEAANLALARLLGGGEAPAPMAEASAPMPMAPPAGPPTSPTAPVGEVMGSALPPVGQPMPPADVPPATAPMAPAPMTQAAPSPAPQMAPQAPPQAAPNPLGITPGEVGMIQEALSSGDPGQIAWAQGVIGEIRGRMSAPAAARQEYQAINGVPGVVDPVTRQWTPLEGGIPQQAMVRDEFNPQGTRPGTLGQRDPFGRLTILDEPPEGFQAKGGRLEPIAGGPQDQAAGGNAITNERNLRGEFQRLTQDYREAQNGFRKVQAAAADGSGASDIALIFGFMKTLDPGSTVREGEFATVQNTGSIPDRVRAAYNQAVSGERIAPELRQEFATTAARQFETYEQGYQNRVAEYLGMAQEYGLNPRNVIGTEAPVSTPRPRPSAPNRPRPAPPAATPPRRTNGQTRRYNPNTGQLE